MSGHKDDKSEPSLDDADAEELAKEAAEGLRQLPGGEVSADAPTIPGIPLEALRALGQSKTEKIRPADLLRSAADDVFDDEEAEAETIPPPGLDVQALLESLPPDADTVFATPSKDAEGEDEANADEAKTGSTDDADDDAPSKDP